jgi:hypothetical protein
MKKDYQKIIDQLLKDVGGSPIYGYATEYSVRTDKSKTFRILPNPGWTPRLSRPATT